jgi:hypothetical protein
MNKQSILAVLCHCDDEILAGFPVMQSEVFEKHLIITCSDVQRKGPRRATALKEVCKQENINLFCCADLDNNFYNLPTRRAGYLLRDAVGDINCWLESAIQSIEPDFLFTHNPQGSYGHGSHRLLFEIISQHPLAKNVIFTDMCQKSNHRSHDEIPRSVRDAYYRRRIHIQPNKGQLGQLTGTQESDILAFNVDTKLAGQQLHHKLDMNFYARTKAIYDRTGSWTWCYPPIETCNLFIINEEQR